MARIGRPAVQTYVSPIAALLDHFLGAIVTRLTQRLQPPQPELVDIAVVRLNVVADRRRNDQTALGAASRAAWPLTAEAQQPANLPTILGSASNPKANGSPPLGSGNRQPRELRHCGGRNKYATSA